MTPVVQPSPFGAWWRHLTLKERFQAFYGTWKRVATKKLYRRAPVRPYEPVVARGVEDASGAVRSAEVRRA